MIIRFPCPACQRVLRVDDQFAGRGSKCPGCFTRVTVPVAPPPSSDFDLVDEPPRSAAIQPAPPARPSSDPFAFDQSATAPAGDDWEHATTDTGEGSLSAGWRSVRGGLQLVRLGAVVNIVMMLIAFTGMLVLALMGAAAASQFMPAAGAGMVRPAERYRSAEEAGVAVSVVILLLGFTLVIGSLIAALMRLIGLARCTCVPARTGAQGLAWGALICELLPLLGYAIMFSAVFIHRAFGPLGQGINGLAALIGLICFLLFLRQVAAALDSKLLSAALVSYVVWLAVSIAGTMAMGCLFFIVIFAVGFGISASEQPRDAAAGMGILALSMMVLFFVVAITLTIILVVKYLGLLTTACNEIRRRGGSVAVA